MSSDSSQPSPSPSTPIAAPITAPIATSADRRNFLKASSLAGAGVALGANTWVARSSHAQGSDIIKVGLVGCGGRGTGAAENAMQADPYAKLVALADLFDDRMDQCQKLLGKRLGKQYGVEPERCYSGVDAYKELINSDVDVVLLCSPPHYRPDHLEAAIAAGKHVFCEKPIATDPTGVRRVLEVAKQAKEKSLNIVSGLCWRYDLGVRETMKRIKDGQIGDVLSSQANYLTGTLWLRPRKPEWTEMEFQMQNWMYFNWLSGDHIVEQFIHSLDKALWLHDDAPPVSAYGLGGRQVRNTPEYGNVYDHFAVVYEWADGTRCHANTRQMSQCFNEVEDFVIGSKGTAKILAHEIKGTENWKYDGPKPSMYDVEHNELFAAIRKGETINNGEYMCNSTMLAIMGREACYSGKKLTWDDMMNSKQDLRPASYAMDATAPIVEVPMPGTYKFV